MNKKIIGTFVPLSALYTNKTKNRLNGCIDDAQFFLDWLQKTNQQAWQLLPIHETHLIPGIKEHVRSPYQSYGIGIDPKYLTDKKITKPNDKDLSEFIEQNDYWLPDYTLFCALRDHFNTDNWTDWEEAIRKRQPENIYYWKNKLTKEIEKYLLIQYKIHQEYKSLKITASEKGIQLIGDLSFYLPLSSPLVWMFQKAFIINGDGSLPRVSGYPNLHKSMYGRQIWGHPLYNWSDKSVYEIILNLFTARIKYLAQVFDKIRLDHASGIFHYGSINLQDENDDQMLKGPGHQIFNYLIKVCNENHLKVFAEDCAVELEELRKAMQLLNVPGIRIYRYSYNKRSDRLERDYYQISDYPVNSIAYTTTHDTETLTGFLEMLNQDQKKLLAEKTDVRYDNDDQKFAKNIRRRVINSPSKTVIIPIQDWLLTKERINIPGTENKINDHNWQYKLSVPVEELPQVKI